MKKIKIGKISRPRGLKGEIKVLGYLDFSNSISIDDEIFILYNNDFQILKIKNYRVIKNNNYLTFHNLENINLVEKYIDCDLYIYENKLQELGEFEFWIDEIVGLKVYQGDRFVGKVVDVMNYPQGDYLVVDVEGIDKLVPFRDEFIIEQTNEIIKVIDLEGLL